MRLRNSLLLCLLACAAVAFGCSEENATGPEVEEPPPSEELARFATRVIGFNYAVFVWRPEEDRTQDPIALEIRVSALDSLGVDDWEEHETGSDVSIARVPDSLRIAVHDLTPLTTFWASYRVMNEDSLWGPVAPWIEVQTPAKPALTPLVEIPEGSFLMGSDPGEGQPPGQEQPQATVDVPRFTIERTEVTNAQYWRFMSEGGYETRAFWSDRGWAWKNAGNVTEPGGWSSGRNRNGIEFPGFPVSGVSLYEAEAYARWAGRRLPKEDEWEKAARGGCDVWGRPECEPNDGGDVDDRPYPWGVAATADRFNFLNSGDPFEPGPSPVGFYNGKSVNGFETQSNSGPYEFVYDLAGNVEEWTASRLADYPYDPNDGREDDVGDPDFRVVVRGGAWSRTAPECRVSQRFGFRPDSQPLSVGFRCATIFGPEPGR